MNVIKSLTFQHYELKSLHKVEKICKDIIYKYYYRIITTNCAYEEVRQDIINELKKVDFIFLKISSYSEYKKDFGLTINIRFKSKTFENKRYGISISLGDVI